MKRKILFELNPACWLLCMYDDVMNSALLYQAFIDTSLEHHVFSVSIFEEFYGHVDTFAEAKMVGSFKVGLHDKNRDSIARTEFAKYGVCERYIRSFIEYMERISREVDEIRRDASV